MGRKNSGWASTFLELFSTKAVSDGRDKTLASTRTTPGRRDWFATISSPVTGEPPASARFRNRGVAKYSSLSRKVSELPTRTTSGVGSLTYRFNVISVPSRGVVDASCSPLPNQAVANPQAVNSIKALRPHFANQGMADVP